LPYRIEQVSARTVRVLGRIDEAIQVAGVNVYPTHIRQVILDCPLVADCDVYAKATAGVSQLYGAVRLRVLNEANREACLRWIRERLSAPETPANLYLY
jgi:long-chain acyl-CoA synthetase